MAVTEGAIKKVSSGGNGGTWAYVRSRKDEVFFYAHLQSTAGAWGLLNAWRPGDLIDYYGNSIQPLAGQLPDLRSGTSWKI